LAKTFTDPRLCAAIVDRLTFGGNIIETGTGSYRLAQTRTQISRLTTADPALTAGGRFCSGPNQAGWPC
jgi:hypothetical protein